MIRLLHHARRPLCFACVVALASHAGCDDGTEDPLPGGSGTAGTGGAVTGGTGGSTTTGTGVGAGGGVGGVGAGGGAVGGSGTGGGTAGMGGAGGYLGACPASGPVDLTVWDTSSWTVPMAGNATLQSISLSSEIGYHYERFEMDFDMTTASVGTPFVCFSELRNQTGNHSVAWRYFGLCVRTDSQKRLINHVFTPSDGRVATTFTMQPNTSYHVNYVFDARASVATATITPSGGTPVSAASSPLTSSISAQGAGLKLLMGIAADHPDVLNGGIAIPRGWTFENLVVHLEPGGPIGAEALPCP